MNQTFILFREFKILQIANCFKLCKNVSHVNVYKKIMKIKYNLKDYMSSWLYGVQIDVLFDEYIKDSYDSYSSCP